MKIMKKSLVVTIDKIRKNLFVRSSLDHDWVKKIAEFIIDSVDCVKEGKEPSHKIHPIVVTPAYRVVSSGKLEYLSGVDYYEIADGRHTLEARVVELGDKEVDVQVTEFDTMAELVAFAYTSNTGGSKPPTHEDDILTIRQLVKLGVSVPKISESLHMSKKLTRILVDEVESMVNRENRVQAFELLSQGLKASEVAEKLEVEEDQVRSWISNKGRRTTGRKREVEDLEKALSNKYRGITVTNNALFKKLFSKLQDQDLFLKDVVKILGRVRKLYERGIRNVDDWEARMKAFVNGSKVLTIRGNRRRNTLNSGRGTHIGVASAFLLLD